MAGDWMKIELELPDKPEVHAIAGMLNLDPDCVVGKLIRVWQWFDKHTVDGNAHGVTFLLPDRISGVTGFGEAMSFVGWLEQHDKTLHMPKFDRHTSESAKTRALAAKRQSQYRNKSNDESNAVAVTTPSQREEKRRDITPLPSFIDPKTWEDFKVHRKSLKKPMSDVAATRLINQLTQWHNQGHDVNQILNGSILNGWQGVFLPNGKEVREQQPPQWVNK